MGTAEMSVLEEIGVRPDYRHSSKLVRPEARLTLGRCSSSGTTSLPRKLQSRSPCARSRAETCATAPSRGSSRSRVRPGSRSCTAAGRASTSSSRAPGGTTTSSGRPSGRRTATTRSPSVRGSFESTHRPTFCVWELGAVWHEQQAWSRYLRSSRDESAEGDLRARLLRRRDLNAPKRPRPDVGSWGMPPTTESVDEEARTGPGVVREAGLGRRLRFAVARRPGRPLAGGSRVAATSAYMSAVTTTTSTRSSAHHAHLDAGSARAAARCTGGSATTCCSAGERARGDGWFARGQRLLAREAKTASSAATCCSRELQARSAGDLGRVPGR